MDQAAKTSTPHQYSKIKLREKMVTLHKQGLVTREIAKRLMESKSTVQRVIKKFQLTGSTKTTKMSKI